MKRLTIVALGAVALSGCMGTHLSKPAVCDGKHRRSANLYGSILPTLPVPLPASQQQGGQSMVEPGPGPVTLPAPPQAPAFLPAPRPALPSSAGHTSDQPPASRAPRAPNAPIAPRAPDAPGAPLPAPKTSERDTALSFISC